MKKYKIGLYEKAMPSSLSWQEKLRFAKRAGYDYLEMSIDDSEEKISRVDMPKKERFRLISDMYEAGLPVGSMCVSALTHYSIGNGNEKLRNRGMEIAKKAILLAAELGIRMVMLPGYDIYYGTSTKETRKYFQDNLRILTEYAAMNGVLAGLETMENEFMNTVTKALDYVKEMDSVYMNVYPDSGNITNAAVSHGGDVFLDLERGKGHVISLHLKESAPGRFREIPYGAGHVNFEGIIQKAWEIGVRRYVTEFWYTGKKDWQDEVYDAGCRMRAILDKMEAV